MRIGLYRGDTTSGPIDKILGAARDAATAGYASFWLPQTMGMDAMAALARSSGARCPTSSWGQRWCRRTRDTRW